MFREIGYKFWKNTTRVFSWRNLPWHFLMIVATYFLVTSGFDWWYFEVTRGEIQSLGLPAAVLGFFVPIIFTVGMYILGEFRNDKKMMNTSVAVAQASIIALLISSAYKAITGRMQPEFYTHASLVDISHDFHFGFLEHGIFWGWPSSHTTVAFAGAVAFLMMYPKNKFIRYLSLIYASYIGLGVSVSIHWFSDVVAGAILGSLIGLVVANSFYHNLRVKL
ncbi:MAG: phosphatase PAP2 family protein [Candidatus Vogelbacteria bacterium]|nr:phosphatase PAP2 family protein [Candidatus Vogelbacteria bacterium]